MKRVAIAFASILMGTSALAQGTFVSERDRSSAMASANEDDGTDFLAIARREAKRQADQQQAAQRAVPAGASAVAAQWTFEGVALTGQCAWRHTDIRKANARRRSRITKASASDDLIVVPHPKIETGRYVVAWFADTDEKKGGDRQVSLGRNAYPRARSKTTVEYEEKRYVKTFRPGARSLPGGVRFWIESWAEAS